jgi:hypothetical protein
MDVTNYFAGLLNLKAVWLLSQNVGTVKADALDEGVLYLAFVAEMRADFVNIRDFEALER